MSDELKKGIPKAIPTGEVIEYTEEEKKKNDKAFEKILKKAGVIKEDDHIIDGQVIKG